MARLSSAAAFVNALLRRAVREPEYDPATEVSDPLEKVAIETSHPAWLIERWTRSFGADEATAFAQANNEVPPTSFRVVLNRAEESEVLSRLRAAGAVLEPSTLADGAWRVNGATAALRELSAAGKIYLQDDASQLVAQTVAVKPGDRVLDLCAAPGGKTTLMADRARDRALIVGADRSATRMGTLVTTMRLQGLESIEPVLLNAAEQLPFWKESFDRVLVDAPCSGTGTLRRNPEIRWRLAPADFPALAQQQKRILARAVEVLKPGGRLVYSTCSVEQDENEEVIREVLAGSGLHPLDTNRTWPHREKCDGFFIAAFVR
jgi:16S rRNA (cytosine967-C5)-methyltransferase